MYPEINLGPLTLQTFGLMFALAFLAAGALVWKRLGEIGKPVDWAYEMGFAALIGGVVGSRVYFLVQNYDERQGRPARQPLLRLRAGLVRRRDRRRPRRSAWAWYRDFLGLALLDLAAPALALGYAIGRFGCQLSGDGDYGKAWDGPWAMSYPDGTVPTDRQSTRRRSTRRWRWASAPGSSGSCATGSAPASSSRSTSSTPGPSASWSSSCAATPTPRSA